ncbi:hypothetical protein D030_3872A, partial [Vibrio parahaemolyticus AQ3810]
MFGELIG